MRRVGYHPASGLWWCGNPHKRCANRDHTTASATEHTATWPTPWGPCHRRRRPSCPHPSRRPLAAPARAAVPLAADARATTARRRVPLRRHCARPRANDRARPLFGQPLPPPRRPCFAPSSPTTHSAPFASLAQVNARPQRRLCAPCSARCGGRLAAVTAAARPRAQRGALAALTRWPTPQASSRPLSLPPPASYRPGPVVVVDVGEVGHGVWRQPP